MASLFVLSDQCAVVTLDTMDKWDEEKLRSVILSKHGNPRTTTDVSSELPLRVSPNPLRLLFLPDRMQTLHRGRRITKVRGTHSFILSVRSLIRTVPGSDGSGNVPTGTHVNIDTPSHQGSSSSPRGRQW